MLEVFESLGRAVAQRVLSPNLDHSHRLVSQVSMVARESFSPLERLEVVLHPWVAFMIMPVFALANAAVPISADGMSHPVANAVAVGLTIGKPLGIRGVETGDRQRVGSSPEPCTGVTPAACRRVGFDQPMFALGVKSSRPSSPMANWARRSAARSMSSSEIVSTALCM
jgi:hypothetical protein